MYCNAKKDFRVIQKFLKTFYFQKTLSKFSKKIVSPKKLLLNFFFPEFVGFQTMLIIDQKNIF